MRRNSIHMVFAGNFTPPSDRPSTLSQGSLPLSFAAIEVKILESNLKFPHVQFCDLSTSGVRAEYPARCPRSTPSICWIYQWSLQFPLYFSHVSADERARACRGRAATPPTILRRRGLPKDSSRKCPQARVFQSSPERYFERFYTVVEPSWEVDIPNFGDSFVGSLTIIAGIEDDERNELDAIACQVVIKLAEFKVLKWVGPLISTN